MSREHLRGHKLSEIASFINPYDTALMYRQSWFLGPLPLPYKEKNPPPLDYTKRVSDYPTVGKIKEWIADGRKHNICVRLAGVTKEYELLGIDVDDYYKGDKKKEGWSQLHELEKRLGNLPETWISSARTDGKSGIRYFRVPRGLAFRGKVDKDIEVIRKGHRFAVVWPSIHPDGGLYWWFPPGIVPDRTGRNVWNGVLPEARTFPVLPENWVDYLSNGKTLATDDELIDVDSSVNEIMDWAKSTFHLFDGEGIAGGMCAKMQQKLELHKTNIQEEATSHDRLTNAHWNLTKLASEGHCGYGNAIKELEDHFKKVTMERGKRGLTEVHGEIFRSRVQALRKLKGQVDDRIKIGARGVDPNCQKIGLCGSAKALSLVRAGNKDNSGVGSRDNDGNSDGDSDDVNNGSGDGSGDGGELDDVPTGAVRGVPEYTTNDDGNASHLVDMFSSLSVGPSFRFAPGYGWIVWHDGNNIRNSDDFRSHWQRDEYGDQVMRRMFQVVRDRQTAYAEACYGDFRDKAEAFIKGNNYNGKPVTEIDVKVAKALYDKWNKWSEKSGNNNQAENAIKAARSISGVSISVNSLDQSPYLLGVANGIVELDRDPENLLRRPARSDDFVTLNTRVPWEKPSAYAQNLWFEYLDTFLPNPELQELAQLALGHTIIGGNPEKVMIVLKGDPNTGKSTMITAIQTALGDYCASVNQSIFQNHKLNPVLANSITKRVIVCSEFDEKDSLSASQVKRITGGSDHIQAELKGSNVTVEGIPQFVPILATNEVPTISGADKALQDRLYVIPFDVTPSHIKKESTTVIEKVCGTAILDWLIEGYKQYRRIGELPVSSDVKRATELFVSELDEIATFASECLIEVKQEGKDDYIKVQDMYDRFTRWWSDNSYRPMDKPSQHKFSRRLKALGFKQTQVRTGKEIARRWTGVKFVKTPSVVLQLPKVGGKPISKDTPERGGDEA